MLLRLAYESLLTKLRSGAIVLFKAACDEREVHELLFWQLAPANCTYYAGHFRGEEYRCLKHYRVHIQSDTRVGEHPQNVKPRMDDVMSRVGKAFRKIEAIQDPAVKLFEAVQFACFLFDLILRIHPFADGNGHVARTAVWAVLGHQNIWLDRHKWPVEPRPLEPYISLIEKFRGGDRRPLEEFILNALE